MQSSGLVSVIIPNYNHARYLDQRIQSVLNQTYQDFELIILDDCSSDGSREVIEKYRGNPHVTQIKYNEENSGSTFIQWQRGFDLAKGEYIWIAESDDYADHSFIETLLDKFNQNPAAVLAYSGIVYVDKDGRELKRTPLCKYEYKWWKGDEFIKHKMLIGNSIANASCAIFRREAISDILGEYRTYRQVGDWVFWIELCKKGSICEVYGHLDFFRQHDSKASPKAHKSGLQMKERHRLYKYLCSAMYISKKDRRRIVGENLLLIRRSHDFNSVAIKNEVLDLWAKESPHPNLLFISTVFRKAILKVVRALG